MRLCFVLLCLALAPAAAQADCYADYKAKQDDPLRLHYGVMQIPDDYCTMPELLPELMSRRLDAAGWTLLSVLSMTGTFPSPEQEANAGPYFLRF